MILTNKNFFTCHIKISLHFLIENENLDIIIENKDIYNYEIMLYIIDEKEIDF